MSDFTLRIEMRPKDDRFELLLFEAIDRMKHSLAEQISERQRKNISIEIKGYIREVVL